jgi:hypothetical protein
MARSKDNKPLPADGQASSGQDEAAPKPLSAPELPVDAEIQVTPEADPDTPAEPSPEPVAAQPVEPATTASNQELSPGDQTTELEDADTDQAVDDIAAHEGDTMLAVQDALGRKHSQPEPSGWKSKLKKLLKSRRTWALIFILILVLFALPVTRYKLLGLVIKKTAVVTVIDSKTGTPVSEAEVSLHGVSAKTNASGQAKLKAAPGNTTLLIGKRYYKPSSTRQFVSLGGEAKPKVRIVATGRQVPITVMNSFTGQPLAGAQVSALKTTVKTDAHGKAVIVLPADAATDSGTANLKGYNSSKITIQVTDSMVPANSFKLVPAGHIYFLSNVGGTMDVVKANLDGSGRQTVLAGTGKEDSTSMTLLASRDWRYLVLKSRRDTAQPVLYLIDTSDDKVTPFDSNNGSFNLIGWSGHDFMYDFVSNTVPQSQAGHEIIKSYDADHQQLNQLDQSQTDGSGDSVVFQDFYNFYVLNNQLVYNTQWYSAGGDLAAKNATIRAIQPDGQNKKDYQTYPSAGLNYVLAALYQPQAVYYDAYNSSSNSTTYYNFANQAVNSVSLDSSTFNRSYPTYLVSPSGNQSFWAAPQNGQNTLFVGDAASQHGKALAGLDDYQPYGWFSDNYLLLSKGGTDLYIVPASGLKSGQQPFKIGYYYKPVPVLNNYGYGYGGL